VRARGIPMNRAARRRAAREARQAPPEFRGAPAQIELRNPVADQFAAFIFGNATVCTDVVQPGSAAGQHLVLCGAGPSLARHAAEWCPQGDQVWGCNSAVTWLHQQGHRVTHGFTVDQTPHMVGEWLDAPPVAYLLASSCHPHLAELLLGKGYPVTFFHNYCGVQGPRVAYGVCRTCDAMVPAPPGAPESLCPHADVEQHVADYEDWLYCALYPPTIRAGSGLNSVNRALDVALCMGFSRITVLGADCALEARRRSPPGALPGSAAHRRWLTEDVVMHADGGHALASGASMMTLEAEIDGRYWVSKPDMLVSAVWLLKAERAHRDVIHLVGDTLPVALRDKPPDFLSRLPTMVNHKGEPMPMPEPT
jgi:hypothetical protein